MPNTTQSGQLIFQGEWDLAHLSALQNTIQHSTWPKSGEITVDAKKITKMDSAGAWLLINQIHQLKEKGVTVHLENLAEEHQLLISLIEKEKIDSIDIPKRKKNPALMSLGKSTVAQFDEFIDFLTLVGSLALEAIRLTFSIKRRIRWSAFASVVYSAGFQALPIIALLSYMIGVVLAYQMGVQLRNYGANVFIVNLLGLSVLREFGPLITAIMIAGRTGSAFTAQLGIMKINQEVDALNTLGVTPGEILLLPRIIGLFIALPLLTMWADIFGILGGMMMANNMLNIGWYDFLHRFRHEIPLRALIIGLGKAPLFALLIGTIGCFQGMRVKSNADSLGKNTTRSVVLGIFFIIVVDAILSVIFSRLKL